MNLARRTAQIGIEDVCHAHWGGRRRLREAISSRNEMRTCISTSYRSTEEQLFSWVSCQELDIFKRSWFHSFMLLLIDSIEIGIRSFMAVRSRVMSCLCPRLMKYDVAAPLSTSGSFHFAALHSVTGITLLPPFSGYTGLYRHLCPFG